MSKHDLEVTIGADLTDFHRGMDQVRKAATDTVKPMADLGKEAKNTGDKLGLLGKIGLAGMGFQAIAGAATVVIEPFRQVIGAASDMAESTSKANVVFGEFADDIKAFAANSAQSMGLSSQKATEMAGTFGNLFTALGLGQGEAKDLSKNILTLGSDLASFNNISVDDALEKLRAGLVGESEPLRALGVNLTEATVQAKAYSMGMGDAAGKLSEQEKVMARYALILDQTKNAQGDFARTSTGMANSQRIISASLADLQVTIGNKLLPAIAPLVSAFAVSLPGAIASVEPAIATVKQVMDALTIPLAAVTGYVIAVQGPMLAMAAAQKVVALATAAQTAVQWALNAAMTANPIGLIVAALAALAAGLVYAYNNSEEFRAVVDTAFASVSAAAGVLKTTVVGAFEGISAFWQSTLQPALASIGAFFTDNIIPPAQAVGRVIEAVVMLHFRVLSALVTNVLLPALRSVGSFVTDTLVPAFTSTADTVGTKVQPVLKTLGDFFGVTLGPALKTANELFGALGKLLSETVGPAAQTITDGAFKVLLDIVNKIGAAIRDSTKWLNDLATSINSVKLPDWLSGGNPGATTGSTRNQVLGYALGGTVPGPMGAPQLAVVHGGETITPPGKGGGNVFNFGGITINNPASTVDVREGVLQAARSMGMA